MGKSHGVGKRSEKKVPSKSSLIRRMLADFEFIAGQILNLRSKPIAHYRKRPEDMGIGATIPSPTGFGDIVCGAAAQDRFDRLVDAICLFEPRLNGTIPHHEVLKRLKQIYSDTFIKSKLSFSTETVQQILDSLIAECTDCLVTTTHHYPCVLFTNEADRSFTVGPVVFTPKAIFFKQLRSRLGRSIELGTEDVMRHIDAQVEKGFPKERAMTPVQSREHVRSLMASAVKSYRPYKWFASVKIEGYQSSRSEEQARKIVDAAIDIIRVILPSSACREIRVAWDASTPIRSAHISTDHRDKLDVRISRSGLPYGPEGWYNFLTRECEDYLLFLGGALLSLTSPGQTGHLQQRLIDAIHWYGDAVTENVPAGKVVKSVSAIERLLFGEWETGRTRHFIDRVTRILDIFMCEVEDSESLAKDVYEARSGALHGSLSPDLGDNQSLAFRTELVARLCILCCAQYYPMIYRLFEDSPEGLEAATKRIVDEGMEWLDEAHAAHLDALRTDAATHRSANNI